MQNYSSDEAVTFAKRLKENIKSLKLPHAFSKVTDHITIKMGIATVPAYTTISPNELIQMADKALYHAKQEGRNQYAIYSNDGL